MRKVSICGVLFFQSSPTLVARTTPARRPPSAKALPTILKEIDDSLRRLRTDVIDLYQVHWPDLA